MADEVQANENAEEVKEEATEEKAVEEKAAEEAAAGETAAPEEKPAAAEEKPAAAEAPVSAPEPEKKKKINKLTMEELNKKIKKMEEAGQMKSRYYKDRKSVV